MQLNSQSPVPNSVLCRSAYCQKSSGNFMWSLYRGLKDWNLPLNVMGISRVVVLFIRCFLLLLSLSLLLFIRYFCHLIIVILLKQNNTTSTSQLPFECFSYIKIILYLQTTIGKDGQRAPQKSNLENQTEAYSLEKVVTSCAEDRTG